MAGRRASTMLGAIGLVVALSLAATPAAPRTSTPLRARSATRAAPYGKIKHVVVIYQENRSFDEVFGLFCNQPRRRCDGYIGPVRLKDGSTVWMAKSPDVVNPDPPHDVNTQARAVDGGKMDGWGHLGNGCKSPGNNLCLTYYEPPQIPSLTAIAGKYVVSDRTFSMQNSPSFGGHMWPAAATQDGFTGDIPYYAYSNGWGCDAKAVADWIDPATKQKSLQPSCVPAPKGYLDPAKYPYNGAYKQTAVPNVPTLFDRLDAAHKPWRIYYTNYSWSVCPTFAKCLYGPQHNNMVTTTQVLTDAKNGTLPAYSLVLPTGPGNDTGQHPPSSMLSGDNWIGKLINAFQASPNWSSTAIFITYDDCGCFFDHVPPGVNPDGTRQGIREPTVIVSPYAKLGATDSNVATFASILRFTEEAFGLSPLGVNDAKAYDYAGAFNFSAPGTGPRVWLRQVPVPEATTRLVASLPSDDDDPT